MPRSELLPLHIHSRGITLTLKQTRLCANTTKVCSDKERCHRCAPTKSEMASMDRTAIKG
eukprot:1153850-Rhodomonas_salina.1